MAKRLKKVVKVSANPPIPAGLLNNFEAWLLAKLAEVLSPVIGPVKALFKLVSNFKDTITGLVESFEDVVETCGRITSKLKNFSLSPKVKNRLVHIPTALEHLQEVFESLKDVGTQISTLYKFAKSKLDTGAAASDELAEAAADIDEITEGLAKLGSRLSALGEKVLGWVGFVLEIFINTKVQLEAIASLCHDVETFVDNLNDLDGLFLPQSSGRQKTTVTYNKRTA